MKPELYNLRIDTKTKSGFLRMKERTLLKQLQRKNEKALEEIMKKYGAYGLVEVKGESNAVIVVDRMLKTAEVEYVTQDTKCGGHALVFVGGSVSAVTAAVDEVKNNAPCKVIQTAVISNPSQEMVDIVEMFKNR